MDAVVRIIQRAVYWAGVIPVPEAVPLLKFAAMSTSAVLSGGFFAEVPSGRLTR